MIADPTTESREQITRMLEATNSVTVVADARDGREAQELVESLSPDILVLDLNISGQDAMAVTDQVHLKRPGTGIIVISSTTDLNVIRQAMLAGATDFLMKPVSQDDLSGSVHQVYEQKSKERAVLSAGGEIDRKGHIVTVYSPQGGAGKSILAGNLAVALAMSTSGKVVLIDLNLHFGDIDLMLNITPENTIAGLAQRYNELDPELMETFLTRHDSGLMVLAAPSTPQYAETITVYVVEQVLDILKETYEYIVIDTPSGMQDTTLAALDATNDILLLTTLDLLALHNTKTALDMLTQMYPAEKIKLVLNRANSQVGITPDDVESTLQFPISCHIPSDGRVVVTSVNEGVPFVMSTPDADISRRIRSLAFQLMGKRAPDEEEATSRASEAPKRGGIFRQLLGVGS